MCDKNITGVPVVDNDNKLTINDEKLDVVLSNADDLPKNEIIKFNQDFQLNINDKNIDYQIQVLTGNKIDCPENCGLGVAYYGDIFIDGIPTKSMKREDLRDLFDMILQDTWLFDGTIRENLVYNKEQVSDEKLDKVCSAVGLKHFISTLKDMIPKLLKEEAIFLKEKSNLFVLQESCC